MTRIAVVMLILAAGVVQTAAQFPIKIPKISKPEISKPTESTPRSNPTTPGSTGDLDSSREMVVDDAFTFFDAEPVKEYDAALRLEKDIGWYMKSSLRIFGTFPDRSGFRVIVSKAGKDVSSTRCEAKPYKKSTDIDLRTPESRKGKDLNYDNHMQVAECFDQKQFAKGEGVFDVKVFVFNGDTDEEKLVRTYKIDVHRAPRVRGSATSPQPDVAHYYISRHAESPVAFMHLIYGGVSNYFLSYDRSPPGWNRVEVYFNYSPLKVNDPLPNAYARCSVNGQRIDFSNAPYRDQVNLTRRRNEYAMYTDRLAPQFQRGTEYRDEVAFIQLRAILPISFGNATERDIRLEDNPGDWSCEILSNGNKIRTFRWKVGSDGKPVPHPEQRGGNVNLYYNAFLIDVDIPPGGAEMDNRLAPMLEKGLFYGIPWTTPEGRALAGAVPKKGDLYQIPSNKVK